MPKSDPDSFPRPLDYATPQKDQPRRGRPVLLAVIIIFAFVFLMALKLIVTPSLTGGRDTAPRVKSASNLRQIGQAIILYSNDHQGEFPDLFQTILLNEDITSAVFVSPLRSESPAIGPTTQAVANQLNAGGHMSYVYLGKGLSMNNVAADRIVAYELPANSGAGSNMLFGDGHVEYIDPATTAKIIAKVSTGRFPVTMPAQ